MFTRNLVRQFKISNIIPHCQSIKYYKRKFSRKTFSVTSDFFDNTSVEALAEKEINQGCVIRKTRASIETVDQLLNDLQCANDEQSKVSILNQLRYELRKIPNKTHPTVLSYEDDDKPIEIASYGIKRAVRLVTADGQVADPRKQGKLKDLNRICLFLNGLRRQHLGSFCGEKSYYLLNDVAQIEQALIRYTTDFLVKNGFELIAVPDILPNGVIEGCGMSTAADRKQVYRIDPTNLCLSGTSEMAIAGYLSGKTFKQSELPKKFVAVSRCYRAEADEGSGIFRVHHFTKVEMFCVCLPSQSEDIFNHIHDIQCRLFSGLGLHFKVFDMPVKDLGASAYRKYDVEAWMPGKEMYGEISSTSNCTDYQSKRLNICVENENGHVTYAHTVNGTACAVPRMIIATLEQLQQWNKTVNIPEALQKYMSGITKMQRRNNLPNVK